MPSVEEPVKKELVGLFGNDYNVIKRSGILFEVVWGFICVFFFLSIPFFLAYSAWKGGIWGLVSGVLAIVYFLFVFFIFFGSWAVTWLLAYLSITFVGELTDEFFSYYRSTGLNSYRRKKKEDDKDPLLVRVFVGIWHFAFYSIPIFFMLGFADLGLANWRSQPLLMKFRLQNGLTTVWDIYIEVLVLLYIFCFIGRIVMFRIAPDLRDHPVIDWGPRQFEGKVLARSTLMKYLFNKKNSHASEGNAHE